VSISATVGGGTSVNAGNSLVLYALCALIMAVVVMEIGSK